VEYLPFVVFGAVLIFFVFQLVKHRGFRGAMFGARIAKTIGELDLGRWRTIRMRVAVHCLEMRDVNAPAVGIELKLSTIGSFGMTPIPLTREAAISLAAMLTHAANASEVARIG
jgi:hypothetical protein